MLSRPAADIEEDLLETRDGELWFDFWRRGDHVGDGFQNGSARWDDIVAGGGGIPVATVL